MLDLYGTTPDKYGYSRYSIAVHTPQELTDKVMNFRAEIGQADLTSEPHISISATLSELSDMDALKTCLQNLAQQQISFNAVFEQPAFRGYDQGGSLAVALTDDLVNLHQTVKNSTTEIIKANTKPNAQYRPHVTLYQTATPEESQKAIQLGTHYDFGDGFEISSIELVGRLGPPRGGSRTIIESFPFGS